MLWKAKRVVSTTKSKEENPTEDEWIWVEGFKGTDKDMMCRGFQYELNKRIVFDGDVEICTSGIHFCGDLRDVFNYYELNNKNRFFHVKALVKKGYNNNLGLTTYQYINRDYTADTKEVSKEIIFLEELTYDNILEGYIKAYYPMIESKEEYENLTNYDEFCIEKFLKEMKILGFSDVFTRIKCDELCDNSIQFTDTDVKLSNTDNLRKYLTKARAYRSEDMGRDMMIYLLENIK